jgi:hypothetical protein
MSLVSSKYTGIVVWRVMYGGLFAFWFDGSIQLVSSIVGLLMRV